MKFTTTLFRRTAVALSAIAALMVTGYATSQTVELRTGTTLTGSCSYSNMSVSPNGNVIVTCGAATTSPGTFTVSGPTSLATNATTAGTTVKITRSGGTTGAVDVAFQVSGTSACASPTVSPISWADAESGSKGIIIAAGGTSGDCVIGITPNNGGVAGGSGTLTIKIVNPDDPVVFAFSAASSNAQVGAGADVITVTRTGGTNGAWSVPITLSGTLSNGGTLPTSNGTLSTMFANFTANTTATTVTYTPPAVMPAANQLKLTLGTPSGPTPASSQTGSLGAIVDHTISLSGPAVGCPAYGGKILTMAANQGNHIAGPSGFITVYTLPTSSTGIGLLGLYVNPYTPQAPGGVNPLTEVAISKCAGDFTNNADGCYQASTGSSQINSSWADHFTSYIGTAAAAKSRYRCMIDKTSTYYVNIRVQYAPGACAPLYTQCGWDPVWKESSS